VLLHLPVGVSDTVIANEALAFGLAPSPLSHWYVSEGARAGGLLLNVAAAPLQSIPSACKRLCEIIADHPGGLAPVTKMGSPSAC
jgi:GntR family transcriptional regulator/MocR family aminotransferase